MGEVQEIRVDSLAQAEAPFRLYLLHMKYIICQSVSELRFPSQQLLSYVFR